MLRVFLAAPPHRDRADAWVRFAADGRVIAELALANERDLLAAYERRRRPANRRSLRFTRAAAFAFGLPEWLLLSSFSSWLVRLAVRNPERIARFLRMASQAFLE